MNTSPFEAGQSGRAPGESMPWYRQLWPWLLMAPPAASVMGGLALAYLAVRAPLALSVEDYADIEAITAREFSADAAAAALGLAADVELTRQADGSARVELVLSSAGERASGASANASRTTVFAPAERALVLGLRHPADPKLDRRVPLTRIGDRYTAVVQLAPARYAVELGPPTGGWRLAGMLAWRRAGAGSRSELTAQTAPARP
jgi:hypothetical protein